MDENEKEQTSIPQAPSPQNKAKSLYIISALILLVLIAIAAYFMISKKSPASNNLTKATNTHTTIVPSPSITPVTSANVDQILQRTDSAVQQSMDQANKDLNTINSIQTSQDSTSGL